MTLQRETYTRHFEACWTRNSLSRQNIQKSKRLSCCGFIALKTLYGDAVAAMCGDMKVDATCKESDRTFGSNESPPLSKKSCHQANPAVVSLFKLAHSSDGRQYFRS